MAFRSLHLFALALSLNEFCGQIFENVLFFLDFLVYKIFFDKNHWFQLLTTKNDWFMLLFLISITLHSLSINHFIMYSVCNKTSLGFCWKLYCYTSPSHLTRQNFVSRFALGLLLKGFTIVLNLPFQMIVFKESRCAPFSG